MTPASCLPRSAGAQAGGKWRRTSSGDRHGRSPRAAWCCPSGKACRDRNRKRSSARTEARCRPHPRARGSGCKARRGGRAGAPAAPWLPSRPTGTGRSRAAGLPSPAIRWERASASRPPPIPFDEGQTPGGSRHPESGIARSLQPPGLVRQFNGVILLLALSLLPGDVQKDVRVASVLLCRGRFDGPTAPRGVPDLQNGPPIELPGRLPVARPLPGPFDQFSGWRIVHPIDRDRLGLLAFQKDVHVDVAVARAVASPSREHASAQVFVRVQLRRRRLDRSRPRIHRICCGFVGRNTIPNWRNPASGVETAARLGGVRQRS